MTNKTEQRLLLFAYYYPPLGGPAVQRPCKTVKYLTRLGWQVDVITIKDTVYHSKDESLLDECTHQRIFRTHSLDPMYLLNLLKKIVHVHADHLYFNTQSGIKARIKRWFPIDDKIGWLPFACRAGKKALLTNRYRAVMVTCGPFSATLAAKRTAAMGRLPLVMDYRDLWTLNNTYRQPRGPVFYLLQKLEKHILNSAALVLTATDYMKQMLIDKFGKNLAPKILPFFNGYDETDFRGKRRERQPDGKIIITYLGTLYGDRPLSFFLKALEQLTNNSPGTEIRFHLVGNFYPETYAEVENNGIKNNVVFIEQLTHAQAIQKMLDSDILLLVIGGAENNWILTGKIFEYMRSGRPILTLADAESEAAGILRLCGHHHTCSIDDTQAITKCLYSLVNISVEQHSNAAEIVMNQPAEYIFLDKYERSNQVQNLAERLACLQ